MIPIRGLVQSVKGWLGKPVASADSDPQRFFGTLYALPNPDPILRAMGRAEQVYNSILSDAHVIGELRSIRGSFRSHEYRVVAGDEADGRSTAARDLCVEWMASAPPNAVTDWMEVMWQMSACIFTGYRPHELVWNLVKGKYLPTEVIDRPGRRIQFDANSNPLLISRANMTGEPVEPYQFVISRHMPTSDNPYGTALLSSCFWPWTFKTGGWRYFVKYCERHGLPWPVGRYPQGSSDEEINKLEEALAGMMDAGYVVAQEGTGLELLTPTGGGSDLPQERLVMLCNRELSKALTSQSMVGEQLQVGSRAASETAKDRQDQVHDSDRDIGAAGMSQIFKWITLFNLGDSVAPPTLEFYKHQPKGKDRAETYQIVADMGAKPSRKAMLEELDIPPAENDADALRPGKNGGAGPSPTVGDAPALDFSALAGFTFAKAAGMTEADAMQLASEAADQVIEDNMIAPVYRMLTEFEAQGKTLAEFRDALGDLVGEMDDDGLREVLDRALTYSMLRGAATNAA
jgi:phage gp29-like protein